MTYLQATLQLHAVAEEIGVLVKVISRDKRHDWRSNFISSTLTLIQ